MHIGLHVKYRLLLSDWNKTLYSSTDFRKIPNLLKIRPVEAEYFQTDGERHCELMSPFIILQRRLNCGKGIYENQILSGIVRPLRDPATCPGVPFMRTGPEMGGHITSTPSLQWVNGKTASAATKGTPARLQVGLLYNTTLGEQPYDGHGIDSKGGTALTATARLRNTSYRGTRHI